MQLLLDRIQLQLQLEWLLSTEPRTSVGYCVQARAACLPMAQQLALVLSISNVLLTGERADIWEKCRTARQPLTDKMLQLLHRLCEDDGDSKSSVQRTANLAIQRHQKALLHQFGQLHTQVNQAVKPQWLSASSQHCCGWLSHSSPDASTAADVTAKAACRTQAANVQARQHQQANDPQRAATAMPVDMADGGRTQAVHAQVLTAAAGNAGCSDDSPLKKRVKRDIPLPAGGDLADDAAVSEGPPNLEAVVMQLRQQLRTLDATCDATSVDIKLLDQALPMAAAAGRRRTTEGSPPADVALYQQLQDLSCGALASLVEGALCSSTSASVTTPRAPVTDVGSTGGLLLSQEALACLLSAVILPRLQQLSTAAPRGMLVSLSRLARQQLDMLSTLVLRPLLLSGDLVAVQGQLLTKLMMEVPAVQDRILALLLQAAGVPAGPDNSSALAFNPIAALSICYWTESHAVLLKALLDISPQLVSAQLDGVVAAVKVAAQQPALCKCTAFAQLLMALTNNYRAVFNLQQVQQLEAAAAATSTFLTRALRTKLQQLKAQHETANS